MSQYRKHLFVCTHGPYCWADGDPDALVTRLKRRVSAANLKDEVRINRSGCLNHCGHGPTVVVYPDAVWYGSVQEDDADEIFDSHLCNDLPVERLRLSLPSGNNKRTSHYADEVHEMKHVEKDLDRQREAARQRIRKSIRPQS